MQFISTPIFINNVITNFFTSIASLSVGGFHLEIQCMGKQGFYSIWINFLLETICRLISINYIVFYSENDQIY